MITTEHTESTDRYFFRVFRGKKNSMILHTELM